MSINNNPDKPKFGERIIENDPEALHESMNEKDYKPWLDNDKTRVIDAAEKNVYKNVSLDEDIGLPGKPRHELGRSGSIVAGVVSFAILAPFVLLLWHWAIGIVF